MGRGVAGRLRSTDWDRLGATEVFDRGVVLEERESKGDGNLLEEEEVEEEVVVVVVVVEVEVEVEGEGEGDMYLEETCLPLGLLGARPFWEF